MKERTAIVELAKVVHAEVFAWFWMPFIARFYVARVVTAGFFYVPMAAMSAIPAMAKLMVETNFGRHLQFLFSFLLKYFFSFCTESVH